MAQAAPKDSGKRTPFVGGNWKCNGTVKSVTELANGLADFVSKSDATSNVDVLVAPISIQIPLVQNLLEKTKIIVACQNVSATGTGAYTGEIAPSQLTDMNINTTLIGHSERRKYYGETNEVTALKVTNALKAGLNVVCCLGESLEERQNDKVEEVCFASLAAVAKGVKDFDESKEKAAEAWASVVIAYEPVWAIGTGVACDKDKAQATHVVLRKWFKENVSEEVAQNIRIIYGGSVKPKNCEELIAQPDIDGFLVGGASLKAETFGPIIESAAKQAKL